MFRPLRPLLRLAGSTAKPLPSAFPRYLTSKSAAFRPSKPAYLTRQTSSLDPTLSSSFWLQVANKHITWSTSPTTALEISPDSTHSWFPDGALNMSANCLDRHLSTRSSQPALVYHSSVGSTNTTYTYSELHTAVSKFAQCLLDLNVKPGDTVLLYMPMIPSAIIAMLACSRIGAVHSVVFGGFAASELAVRIDDAKPVVVVAATFGIEGTKVVEYMPNVNDAIEIADHTPKHCVVVERTESVGDAVAYELKAGRDLSYDSLLARQTTLAAPSILPTNAPLYTIYTSGTTGDPKGILRDQSHAVMLAYSMESFYGVEPGEVFFAASDIGWVVGHSYIVYAPLLRGCTTVLYEGKPVGTPDAGEYWRIVEEYGVNAMFTAPTALRAIRKADPKNEFMTSDMSTLRAIFVAGERCDPGTVEYFEGIMGKPVVDHWWQTESGTPMCGVQALEVGTTPGSCGLPLPGYDMKVLDEKGEGVDDGVMGSIAIKLPLPPGFMTTLYNNHERFKSAYLEEFPGFYAAGDAGFKDSDGYIHIMERTDDAINVAGHRLSTGLLEETVLLHPDVPECAVVGVRDELKGVVPLCLFVSTGAEGDEKVGREVVDIVREKVGAVAAMREAIGVSALPKTRSGKILRAIIRKIADGDEYKVPGTIEDASVVEDIVRVLRKRG